MTNLVGRATDCFLDTIKADADCEATYPAVHDAARAVVEMVLAEAMRCPEVQALVDALNQYQLAAAGFVSVQSARDKADAALAAFQQETDQ